MVLEHLEGDKCKKDTIVCYCMHILHVNDIFLPPLKYMFTLYFKGRRSGDKHECGNNVHNSVTMIWERVTNENENIPQCLLQKGKGGLEI